MSSYPNGFANGLSVRGMPINIAYPGQVLFVNNSGVLPQLGISGSDGNPGTYLKPLATLQKAVDLSLADRGDIIMLMPGHAETVSSATALQLNKAGILIVGLGQGSKMAQITLDTANTATIPVSAANIGIINVKFIANFLAIAALFTVTAANFVVQQCDIRDTSAILNFAKIVNTGSTDNAADGLVLESNNVVSLHATNAYSMFAAVGNMDRVCVKGNNVRIASTSGVAVVCPISTGKLLTNFLLKDNIINSTGAAATATGLLITTNGTTNTGMLSGNQIFNLSTAGGTGSMILVTASSGLHFMNNYYSNLPDSSGKLLPAAIS